MRRMASERSKEVATGTISQLGSLKQEMNGVNSWLPQRPLRNAIQKKGIKIISNQNLIFINHS